jgi:predicted DNA-binding transcriptional regulator YafY
MYHATRPPLRRIMAIDLAVRAGEWPNARTLHDQFEVSDRTIRRDITYMRDQLGAPLEFDVAHNGYFYTEPAYRLPLFQMTEGELLALYLAERMLRQLEGTPFDSDLRRAIGRLGTLLPDGMSVRLDEKAEMLAVLPATRPHYDAESFLTLGRAAVSRQRIEMVYWTASRNSTNRRRLDPYELVLLEDGWYAAGYCHTRKEVRLFAVQRVRSARTTGESFERPAGFRIEDYMQGSFRAVRGDGNYRVVLRFARDVAGRITEKEWHPSQTVKVGRNGSVTLTMHVSSLIEVKRWALSWGADCEVVEPEELRELIKSEILEMLRLAEQGRPRQPRSVDGNLTARGQPRRSPPAGRKEIIRGEG